MEAEEKELSMQEKWGGERVRRRPRSPPPPPGSWLRSSLPPPSSIYSSPAARLSPPPAPIVFSSSPFASEGGRPSVRRATTTTSPLLFPRFSRRLSTFLSHQRFLRSPFPSPSSIAFLLLLLRLPSSAPLRDLSKRWWQGGSLPRLPSHFAVFVPPPSLPPSCLVESLCFHKWHEEGEVGDRYNVES